MKKILWWKLYDTEKSVLLAKIDNLLSETDFKHFKELLYITKDSNFFLHWEWWPLTRYGIKTGSNWINGSSSLIALTLDDLYIWLDDNSVYLSDYDIDNILKILPKNT